ncbi:hypothetical protein [Saliphagus sp. LR7]|uniref:hypothetical protein n=1 Tax=Saliphagus sp. LR7 TaxID=2282654 RepID=UPI000DF79EB5|nr:hypothetical protein [Saliphagus sp. LR7]
MERVWVTNGSTSVAPIVNPLNAACREGFEPTDVYVLDNPFIEEVTDRAVSMIKTIVTAHGGDEPTVTVETIEEERDFEAIVEYLQTAIEAGHDGGAEIAVDVTPGRKFWSIISFQAGRKLNVDHLYYVHLDGGYFGESYPVIPRTAIELIDFTEVL